ncbi:MAG: ribonuclease R family protein [Minisyncoccia bacterium]
MQGQLSSAKRGPNKKVSGIIEITRRGTGYLPYSAETSKGAAVADIAIETEELHGALNGDEVEVEITSITMPTARRGLAATLLRPHGKVVRIMNRAREEFVCTLKPARLGDRDSSGGENAERLVAVPDDARFYRPINVEFTKPYGENEKVVVRLVSFDGTADPMGEITEVLGKAGGHRVEMNAIVLEHGFATKFPAEVAAEAKEIEKNHATVIANEVRNAVKLNAAKSDPENLEVRLDTAKLAGAREDFRDRVTFTIDPKSAKDFDDALSVRELSEGEYEIGVHIADVSFFVREGSALDEEAIKRGTSVYLVDATIPMLPEELSGNVCSLKEGEDRLAFSAIFRMDKNARVLERRFVRTIIRSDKHFTYEEAQEMLDKTHSSQLSSDSKVSNAAFLPELTILRDLARTLRTDREKNGAIDFGDNEFSFTLDSEGKPTAIHRKERIETNLLIEEFMLLANREVAAFVAKRTKDVPESRLAFVYRIHDKPKEDRIEELATFVRAVGYEFGNEKKQNQISVSAHDIQKLLRDIKGTPEEQLIRTATLRSMAKAVYSTKNIGHFGLAFKYYTHFTSPIRRYPDVLVHRLLVEHLGDAPISHGEYVGLEKLCLSASEQEARAADAERESVKYKQVEYMTPKVGQEFDGTISGVTEWGLYVEENETGAEGLVRIANLKDDYYTHEAKKYALVGERRGKKYALGDAVRVKLLSADLTSRQLEFGLVSGQK